ncbi:MULTISPECIES: cardiolipin synthase ClsB [Pseudomonas]|uniref:cardiolipin synthase ClsB n=1 Tax=Pseudomonas nitroreducens TaxID=46680 RepID=UPI001E624CD3|nr:MULTISPECIES: cardiolipin synthase ClsB [Pseudomonas]MCE4072394.1 cardiolipin synthase ClsB [Pseudomonas nitritireducens]MCE4081741.1 cardiolipin synthase ClsB [Pseudomonas nitroreducens]
MNEVWRNGNRVELLINGEDFFPSVFRAIEQARHEVLLETFILRDDKVGRALRQVLIDAAGRGVRVEVIADGYGTPDLDASYLGGLLDAGVRLHLFDPQPLLLGIRTNLFRRLHRKHVVVDGALAFVGGINFCADHLADFGPMAKQDYAVRIEGPGVEDVRRACLELLSQYGDIPAADAVHPGGVAGRCRTCLAIRDNLYRRTEIEQHYLRAIGQAKERLLIANAYFFPGYRLLRALRDAARRGVRVRLILQGLPDMPLVRLCSKLLYDTLLRDGVEIHEYCDRPLHGKVAVADRRWATVGSSNLDPLSLSLNLEGNLMIEDGDFCAGLDDHLEQLANQSCRRVTRQYARRGYWWRAPLVFASFHFLRHFPAIAGQLPAHRQILSPASLDEEPGQSQVQP